VLAGCGQSAALADKAKDPDQAAAPVLARPTITQTEAAPIAVGPLYYAHNLKRFWESLAALDEGKAQDDVRILVYGDSHTAADFETGAVRRTLQARFGDGGRGFVYLGKPWRTYLQEGVKQPGMSREWTADLGKVDKNKTSDMCLGLGGVCLLTQRKARAWAEITSSCSKVEVDYFQQPSGGSFEVWIDGARAAKIATSASTTGSAFKTLDVPEGPHAIEVRTAGDGNVRLFGVALDRSSNGLVLDALGINGARVQTALAWNEQHMTEQLQHRKPDLVVLSYGTNESFDDTPIDQYERALVDLLGRIARAVPTASCLLMGPPDHAVETKDGWISSPRLAEVVAAQKRVAEAAGCAFFDQLEAMGGAGTALLWYEEPEPRMAKDRVHLTRTGYAQLGVTFSTELLRAYGAYRADKGLPPIDAPAPSLPMVDKRVPVPSDEEPSHRGSPFLAIPM
jgi:lysophospholipase L1-like esterase